MVKNDIKDLGPEDLNDTIHNIISSLFSYRALYELGISEPTNSITITRSYWEDLYRWSNLALMEIEDSLKRNEGRNADRYTYRSYHKNIRKEQKNTSNRTVIVSDKVLGDVLKYMMWTSIKDNLNIINLIVDRLREDNEFKLELSLNPRQLKSIYDLYGEGSMLVTYLGALSELQEKLLGERVTKVNTGKSAFHIDLMSIIDDVVSRPSIGNVRSSEFIDRISPLISLIEKCYKLPDTIDVLTRSVKESEENIDLRRFSKYIRGLNKSTIELTTTVNRHSLLQFTLNSVNSTSIDILSAIEQFVQLYEDIYYDHQKTIKFLSYISSVSDIDDIESKFNEVIAIDDVLDDMSRVLSSISMYVTDKLISERNKTSDAKKFLSGASDMFNKYAGALE